MIEVGGLIADHAKLAHDVLRGLIGRRRIGDDFAESEPVEAEGERRLRRFGCDPPPPGLAREPPSDLDRRRERRLEADPEQSDRADERAGRAGFNRPHAEAVLGLMRNLVVDPGIAGLAGRQRAQKLHHDRIGRHRRERRAVVVPPLAQDQAFGFDDHDTALPSSA